MAARFLAILLFSLLLSAQSFAQVPPSHRPVPLRHYESDSSSTSAEENSLTHFWIGVGLGYGSATAVCTSCGENGLQSGTTANVHLGFGLNRQLLLGLQASIWINDGGIYHSREDNIYRTHLMIMAQYYPWVYSHFFGRLGAGLSVYNAYNRFQPRMQDANGNDLPSLVHTDGPGVSVAVGYDFGVAGDLVLSPVLSYSYAHLGDLVLNDTRVLAGNKPLQLLELNLGLMFRSPD